MNKSFVYAACSLFTLAVSLLNSDKLYNTVVGRQPFIDFWCEAQ